MKNAWHVLHDNPVRRLSLPAVAGLLLALAIAPFVLTAFWTFVVIQVLITLIIVVGLNMVVGNAGQLTLASTAFYAVGAYVYAHASEISGSVTLGLLAAILVPSAIGGAVGYVALRLRGLYLAIVTFGLILVVQDLIVNLQSITGGAVGMPVRVRGAFSGVSDVGAAYALTATCALLVVSVAAVLERTSFGRALEGIRQAEDAAAAFGINRLNYALKAFVFSCATAGLAGGLYGVVIGYLSPEAFGIHAELLHLTILVVGGLGSVAGSVIGTLTLGWLGEVLRNYPGLQEIVYGVLLLVFLLAVRGGIVGATERLKRHVTSESDVDVPEPVNQ